MRSSKTKGELCPGEAEIDIPRVQRAGITDLVARRLRLPRSGLANNANLHQASLQQTGHLVDVGGIQKRRENT